MTIALPESPDDRMLRSDGTGKLQPRVFLFPFRFLSFKGIVAHCTRKSKLELLILVRRPPEDYKLALCYVRHASEISRSCRRQRCFAVRKATNKLTTSACKETRYELWSAKRATGNTAEQGHRERGNYCDTRLVRAVGPLLQQCCRKVTEVSLKGISIQFLGTLESQS